MNEITDKVMDAEEAAGFWDARLRAPDCSDNDRKAHEQWKMADPANARAFEALQAMIEGLPSIASKPEIQSMRAAALARSSERHSNKPERTNWLRIGGAIAACLVLALVPALLFFAPGLTDDGNSTGIDAPLAVYSTAVGERSDVPLADGSIATLNTDTAIDFHFDRGSRAVHLVQGEAFFDVAHDPDQPFVVYAGKYEVIAVGTAFSVKSVDGSLDVVVTEGRVAIRRVRSGETGRQHSQTFLDAGQQFIGRPTGRSFRLKADLDKAIAWRDGRAVFDDTPLARAAEEMNRYSAVKLRISDPDLARKTIDGMFITGNQDSFVEALETYFGARAKRVSDTEILLEPGA